MKYLVLVFLVALTMQATAPAPTILSTTSYSPRTGNVGVSVIKVTPLLPKSTAPSAPAKTLTAVVQAKPVERSKPPISTKINCSNFGNVLDFAKIDKFIKSEFPFLSASDLVKVCTQPGPGPNYINIYELDDIKYEVAASDGPANSKIVSFKIVK